MEEIISLDNVSYIRNGKYILKDINWHVNRGEHWVILGPNGSGKTTTLNMVNGYIFPSQGHVKVLEFEFGHSSIIELRKRIGWVSSALSQFIPTNDYPLHIVLSGKFASLGLWEKVDDDDIARANEILDLLKIRHLAERKYGMLSQGEKQKVLIGRALMNHPDIIIFRRSLQRPGYFRPPRHGDSPSTSSPKATSPSSSSPTTPTRSCQFSAKRSFSRMARCIPRAISTT